MSTVNSKLLEFFARIPKLEPDGSNWVIFKDHFLYAAAAASLKLHIDGTGKIPISPVVQSATSATALTETEVKEISDYEAKLSEWHIGEAIIKQAIATIISDSLFLEVRKEETALKMWEAVKNQREKKSRMVTVDMQ